MARGGDGSTPCQAPPLVFVHATVPLLAVGWLGLWGLIRV